MQTLPASDFRCYTYLQSENPPSSEGLRMINVRQAMLGLFILSLGLGVYVLGRNFVPIIATPVPYGHAASGTLRWLLGFIPSFIHALAFCLLTACLFPTTARTSLIICSVWAGLHVLLEIGQTQSVSNMLAPLFSLRTSDSIVLLRIETYFRLGVFDFMDVISAMTGCLAGYILINHPMTRNYSTNKPEGRLNV
ncbi:MAG: hypothetical protein SWH61_03545 [Thermodesulfobacteriota bacterium]|nr:hypothetical protein [Thermodesulfobacteriota bacterium]